MKFQAEGMKRDKSLEIASLTKHHILSPADSINTHAKVTLEDGKISTIHLDVKAKVPGMSADQFATAANEAKANCPISKSLNAEITMDASIEA